MPLSLGWANANRDADFARQVTKCGPVRDGKGLVWDLPIVAAGRTSSKKRSLFMYDVIMQFLYAVIDWLESDIKIFTYGMEGAMLLFWCRMGRSVNDEETDAIITDIE